MRAYGRTVFGMVSLLAWSLARPAAQAQEPVDLLHAVGTELAVSTVYRNQRTQAERLVDGDAATVWNSATGDLVGAWIEVRLPADATVSAISLIPGFPGMSGNRDLSRGNHRVAAIRVLREGVEVGRFPVAHERPEFVTIPVRGAGGVWRIELAELRPGLRTDWREVCIAELRMLGRAPAMSPGMRLPRVAVGALPAPRVPAAVDPVALERSFRRELGALVPAWRALQDDYFSFLQNTGEPMPDAETVRAVERTRASILRRIVALVEPIDPARADAVRMAGMTRLAGESWRWEPAVLADLAAISAALDVVAARLGTDDARCRASRTLAELRLQRVAGFAGAAAYFDEIDAFEAGGAEEGRGGSAARSSDRARLRGAPHARRGVAAQRPWGHHAAAPPRGARRSARRRRLARPRRVVARRAIELRLGFALSPPSPWTRCAVRRFPSPCGAPCVPAETLRPDQSAP